MFNRQQYLVSASLALAVALAGCGGSTTPANSAADATATTQTVAANWTTLGTRAQTSKPGTSIVSNSGAKWADYNPAVLYPKTVQEALQYITMPDGTKLAAYLTMPADSSG